MDYSEIKESKLPKIFVDGEAHDIKHVYHTSKSVLSFRLTREGEEGVQLKPIKVITRGYQITGSMSEGDRVRVYYKTFLIERMMNKETEELESEYIKNLNTQIWIKAQEYFEGRVLRVEWQQDFEDSSRVVDFLLSRQHLQRTYKVLHFTIERKDFNGQILPQVPVQMRGLEFYGNINEGDVVRVNKKRKKEKTIETVKVLNLTTGTIVKAKD